MALKCVGITPHGMNKVSFPSHVSSAAIFIQLKNGIDVCENVIPRAQKSIMATVLMGRVKNHSFVP